MTESEKKLHDLSKDIASLEGELISKRELLRRIRANRSERRKRNHVLYILGGKVEGEVLSGKVEIEKVLDSLSTLHKDAVHEHFGKTKNQSKIT